MSDSEPETTASVRFLENEALDRINETSGVDPSFCIDPKPINELDPANWREELMEEGFCFETLGKRMHIGMNLAALAPERNEFLQLNAIKPPDFDPRCFGRPLVWNSCDATSKLFAKYKVVRGWGKWAVKHYGDMAYPKTTDPKHFISLVREFLHVRPLAYEIEKWIEYWIKKRLYDTKHTKKGKGLWGEASSDEEVEQDPAPKPAERMSGSKPARRCADCFDWSKIEPFEIKGKRGTFKGYKVAFLAGGRSASGNAGNVKVGYHGCNAYAL